MEKLPAELLLQIAKSIPMDSSDAASPRTGRRRALRSLCLTSRNIYKHTVSELYADLGCLGYRSRTKKLLRTLCERPDLVEHVHSYYTSPVCLIGEDPALSQEEASLFKSAIGDLISLDFYAKLYDSLTKGCSSAEIVLIMILAQNVRNVTLTVRYPKHWRTSECQHCPDMEEAIYTFLSPVRLGRLSEGAYSNLKSVVVQGDAPTSFSNTSKRAGVSHQILNNILQLPSLARLVCNDLEENDSTSVWTDPEAHHLSELYFDKLDRVGTAVFARIIRSCKRLERLRIRPRISQDEPHWGPGFERHYGLPGTLSKLVVDVGELQVALNQHRESLTHLEISNQQDFGQYWHLQAIRTTMTFLHFSTLKTLIIDQRLLLARVRWVDIDLDSILPQSLRVLIINTHHDINDLPAFLMILNTYSNNELSCFQITMPALLVSESTSHDGFPGFVWKTPPSERAWKLRLRDWYRNRHQFEFSVRAVDMVAAGIRGSVLHHAVRARHSWPSGGRLDYIEKQYEWVPEN